MSEQTLRTDKWNESMCGVWRIDTTEQLREAFEVKANEIGMVLDCHFFESGNNYTDDDTRLAYSLFEAGWQAATAQAVPEGCVVVPTTNVHTFYQDDDEPENCCNDESEFDLLGDGLNDGDIIIVNKITSTQLPSEKFYGTWVVDASNRKFELFVSYAEAAQAIKAAQEGK